MNILFLTTHVNAGGITSYLLTLARGVVQAGNKVTVVSSGGQMAGAFNALGAEHVTVDLKTKSEASPKICLSWPRLTRLVKERRIDVVHAQTRVTQVEACLLRVSCGVKVVTTCHGFFRPRFFRRRFPCWGDRVIAISPAVQDHLESDLGVPSEKICLVKSGLPIEDYPVRDNRNKDDRRRMMSLPAGKLIGIIARLSDVKGHAVVLDALPKVLEHVPDAILVIVGQGKEEGALKQQAQRLGLAKNVVFTPRFDASREMLPLFDCFVMPSLQEGLGLSIMEAQAVGLPVVASNVGGIPTLIHDRQTGLLVEPADPRQLAKALTEVLTHPDLAETLGRQAREFISNEFQVEKMIQGTSEVYASVLGEDS